VGEEKKKRRAKLKVEAKQIFVRSISDLLTYRWKNFPEGWFEPWI
jgi:hypothetical protein